jgi:hypothetical protein
MIIVDDDVVRRGLLATECGTDRATMDRNVPRHDIWVSLIANLYNDEAHIVLTVPVQRLCCLVLIPHLET